MVACLWLWLFGTVAGVFGVEFPNPQKEFRLCGRNNASFVCDPEFILDIGDAERLDQLAHDFRRSTKCLCPECETGISLGIFIRSRLTQESAKQYPSGKSIADMLRKRWHLGKCNDDIVIILLTEMNISDYSLGPAVQKVFSADTAELIMKDCKIHFLSAWYYQGLESVVTSFNDALVKIQTAKKASSKSLITGLSLGIGVLLILLLFAILILRRQRKRRKKGCRDVYESVPTKNNNESMMNSKIFEYDIEKMHNDEDEEDSDDDNEETLSQQFSKIKRHLSAVVEESDENETFKNSSLNSSAYFPQGTNRSQQVTEL